MTDLQDASRQVVNTGEIATVALIAIAGVSLAALFIALIALERSMFDD